MAILSYFTRFTMKRGECRQLEFWLEKEQILEMYSAQLQKSWNSTEVGFGINKNYWAKETPEGAHTLATRVGARPTPLGAPPASWAPWWPSDAHLLLYGVFRQGKNHKQAFGRDSIATRRNLGGTNLGLRQSCSAGDTSLWEWEIMTIAIINDPLIGRGSISINIFTSTISSQTLVHLLYPIFVPKPQIGTCVLLVVLITPCSWC